MYLRMYACMYVIDHEYSRREREKRVDLRVIVACFNVLGVI